MAHYIEINYKKANDPNLYKYVKYSEVMRILEEFV